MIAWASIGLALADPCADAARYPDDYGSQVACARDATSDGDLPGARDAWGRAWELSGGREAAANLVDAHLNLGEPDAARSVALVSLAARRDAGWPYLLAARVEAGRHGDAGWSARLVEAPIREAVSMEPQDSEIRCAADANADARGARQFDTDLPCLSGPDRPVATLWATTGLSVWKKEPVRGLAVLAGGLSTRRVWFGATARTVGTADGPTRELWLWGGGRSGRLFGTLAVGEAGGAAIAARGGWTRGAWGMSVGAARTPSDVGAAGQIEVQGERLLGPGVRLAFGPRLTTRGGRVGVAGEARLTLVHRSFSVDWIGRYGVEHQPLRFDGPTLYTLDAPLTASTSLSVWRSLHPSFDVGATVEALRVGAAFAVLPSLSVVFHPGGKP